MQALTGLPETDSRTQPQRKPEGGFCFFTVIQLLMAWTALREGQIGIRELRVFFALAEMKSRRCGANEERPPRFSARELQGLVGRTEGQRKAVKKLLAVGLLRTLNATTIEFATEPSELHFEPKTLDQTLDLISHPDRRVPVPRRIIRLIAGGAHRILIATILGHLIRCLFYKQGACHPRGCVKASWIAQVFGVSERRVHEQRQHLIALGWLLPEESSQKTLNRHGLWVTINLAWDRLTEAKERFYDNDKDPAHRVAAPAAPTPAPEAPSTAPAPAPEHAGAGEGSTEPSPLTPPEVPPISSPPPAPQVDNLVTPYREENKEPLRESKNQKPASSGPTGVYFSHSDSKKTPTSPKAPNLRNVTPDDLRDPARLLDLYDQATAAGYVSPSEASRLNFFAAAAHARVIGSRNPPGLFVRIIRSGLWAFLTQDDEDVARRQLRQVLYPEPERTTQANPFLGKMVSQRAPGLSDDARFVRDITNVLRQRGIPESSVWRLVNRERPEWTRERWDQARAELQGVSSPLAAAAAIGY